MSFSRMSRFLKDVFVENQRIDRVPAAERADSYSAPRLGFFEELNDAFPGHAPRHRCHSHQRPALAVLRTNFWRSHTTFRRAESATARRRAPRVFDRRSMRDPTPLKREAPVFVARVSPRARLRSQQLTVCQRNLSNWLVLFCIEAEFVLQQPFVKRS